MLPISDNNFLYIRRSDREYETDIIEFLGAFDQHLMAFTVIRSIWDQETFFSPFLSPQGMI